MRNHNHATRKLLLSYAGVDGKVITYKYDTSDHPICLDSVRNYVRTGKWSEGNVLLPAHDGGWYDSRSHAIVLYESFPWTISHSIADRCVADKDYAALVMDAATKCAKEKGESISTVKAQITRMRNKNEDPRDIAREYAIIIHKYRLFRIVDFDYQEPVCEHCGKIYPDHYTLNVGQKVYCVCCANEIVHGSKETGLAAKTIRLVKDALYESPDRVLKSSEEQIYRQIQSAVAAQTEFSQFVNRMAEYYTAGEEEGNIQKIYERVWKEVTIERFNAHIDSIATDHHDSSLGDIAKILLSPRFELVDVITLLKQIVK